MAVNRQRASSEKLPPSSSRSGTVLSREQLRRQLTENSLLPAALPTPTNGSHNQAGASARKVRFEGAPPTAEGQKEQLSSSSSEQRTTARQSANQNEASFKALTLPPQTANQSGASFKALTLPLRTANQNGTPGPSESVRVRRRVNGEGGGVEALVRLYEDEGKVKGVLELSTFRQRRVPHIKVRVICLIDVSGSMLLKGDQQRRRSKISILKTMAVDIIDALEDEEDFFGVMTFGEETRELCPLTRVTSSTRTEVKSTLSRLDKCSGFSSVTDLSSALQIAVETLSQRQQEEGLLYRNCIIVFSDGEVNAGETDPKNLVHLTREKMRECQLPQDVLADLWVNISCVTTGTDFSQTLYFLSKMCGSDAYFYVDGSKDFPEADMMIPLMLRKTACAQMVSVTIRANKGALLDTGKCSQEYSVRRRRGAPVERDIMAYFLHDLPSGVKKTFHISLDLEQVSSLDEDFLAVDVQYVDPLGVLYNITKSVCCQEVVSLNSDRRQALEVMALTAKNQLRSMLQDTCRQVATVLENYQDDPKHTKASVKAAVEAGKKEVKKLASSLLHQLEAGDLKEELKTFVQGITANMTKLLTLVEKNPDRNGKCWQYTKAISSAIARELPTVTSVVAQSSVLCPLPKQGVCESKRTQALSIFVLGEEEEEEEEEEEDGRSRLHTAAKDVARSLADVLKAMETASHSTL